MDTQTKAPERYKCLKCDHEWTGRLPWLPTVCPKCKSYRWNEPPDAK